MTRSTSRLATKASPSSRGRSSGKRPSTASGATPRSAASRSRAGRGRHRGQIDVEQPYRHGRHSVEGGQEAPRALPPHVFQRRVKGHRHEETPPAFTLRPTRLLIYPDWPAPLTLKRFLPVPNLL